MILIFQCTLHCAIKGLTTFTILEYNVQCNKLDDVLVTARAAYVFIEIHCCCWCSGYGCLLGKSEIAGLNPTLARKFRRNKMFLLHLSVKIQYCGEPP